ncbi:unnamed protein product [Periconia digitata]|uniref:Uncharacterized protein n=1 Tax=Periconia digitata TaxID=1303443 RepID=A0A9W4UU35_9PLEO|nr:unnamed protein product [Periconia digitata]
MQYCSPSRAKGWTGSEFGSQFPATSTVNLSLFSPQSFTPPLKVFTPEIDATCFQVRDPTNLSTIRSH